MIALVSSIAALLVGPALLSTGRGGARAVSAVDAFVVVVVVGVVFLHYVPHALLEAGPIVLLGMLIGLCLPYWAEQASRARSGWVKPVALLAFALHAGLDGAAMAGTTTAHVGGVAFALALVVHRVAEGLAIQHLTRSAGVRATSAALAFIALATVAGYVLGERALSMGESQVFLFVQTLSSGALLHVVVHGHGDASGTPRSEAAGTLVGLLVMAALVLLDPELAENAHELSMGETVLALALHIAPALLIATALTVLLERRIRPHVVRAASESRLGALLCGLVSAPCAEHAHGDHGRAQGRAELVSALAHPAIWAVSAVLLGPRFATLRLVAGAACALLLPMPDSAARACAVVPSFREVFARGLRASLGFLVVGLLAAAWLEPVVPIAGLAQLPAAITIPLAALLGLPLHACAIGLTPLLVVLAHKQLDVGALLALLLATGMARVAGLSRTGPQAGRWLRTLVAFVTSCGFGFLAHGLFRSPAFLDLHAHAGAAVNEVERVCLAVTVVLLARVLFVRGSRAVFAPLWPSSHHPH